MEVVVDEPGVARQRDTLTRGREVGLAHHAILEVAQLVGGGGEQVDQHLVVVGLAGARPARHTLGHRHHQRVAEGVVVLRQIVDRRVGRWRPAGLHRRAVVGEATGPELEADRAEEWIDEARVPDQFERVSRVVAHRRDAQREPRRIDANDRRDLHLPGRIAGHDARAAAHAKDLACAHRVAGDVGEDSRDVQAVEETQIDVGMVGTGPRGQRHQRELQAVQAVARQHSSAIVNEVGEGDGGHRLLLRAPLELDDA